MILFGYLSVLHVLQERALAKASASKLLGAMGRIGPDFDSSPTRRQNCYWQITLSQVRPTHEEMDRNGMRWDEMVTMTCDEMQWNGMECHGLLRGGVGKSDMEDMNRKGRSEIKCFMT